MIMKLTSKKISPLLLVLVSLILSRITFLFINDPEGPNVLIVTGLALVIFSLISGILYIWKRNKSSQ